MLPVFSFSLTSVTNVNISPPLPRLSVISISYICACIGDKFVSSLWFVFESCYGHHLLVCYYLT